MSEFAGKPLEIEREAAERVSSDPSGMYRPAIIDGNLTGYGYLLVMLTQGGRLFVIGAGLSRQHLVKEVLGKEFSDLGLAERGMAVVACTFSAPFAEVRMSGIKEA